MYLASLGVIVTSLVLQFAIRPGHISVCSPAEAEPFLLGCSCGYNELVNYNELWYVHMYLVTTCTNMNSDLIRDKGRETSAVSTTPESAMLSWTRAENTKQVLCWVTTFYVFPSH